MVYYIRITIWKRNNLSYKFYSLMEKIKYLLFSKCEEHKEPFHSQKVCQLVNAYSNVKLFNNKTNDMQNFNFFLCSISREKIHFIFLKFYDMTNYSLSIILKKLYNTPLNFNKVTQYPLKFVIF